MSSKKSSDDTKKNRPNPILKKIKKIYTPRPDGCSDTDGEAPYVDPEEPPYWHKQILAISDNYACSPQIRYCEVLL